MACVMPGAATVPELIPVHGEGWEQRCGAGGRAILSRKLGAGSPLQDCRTALSEGLQDSNSCFEELVTERLIPVTDPHFQLSSWHGQELGSD